MDQLIDHLLRLEHNREPAVALAAVGIGLFNEKSGPKFNMYINNTSMPVDFSIPEFLPLSNKGGVEDPKIWELHEHSSLGSKEETEAWLNNPIKFNNNTSRIENLNHQTFDLDKSHDKSSLLGQ